MQNLAELSFAYLWHLMFTEEDKLEADLAVRQLESLADYLAAMSDAEQVALVNVARATQARLLAPPDAQVYTFRKRLPPEQKQFLDEMISGAFFKHFE